MTEEITFAEDSGNLISEHFKKILSSEETFSNINAVWSALKIFKSEISETAFKSLTERVRVILTIKNNFDLYFESGEDETLFVGYIKIEKYEDRHKKQLFRFVTEGRRPKNEVDEYEDENE